MKIKICFHLDDFTLDALNINTFFYAFFNEKYLNNVSIFLVPDNVLNEPLEKLLKNFTVIKYSNRIRLEEMIYIHHIKILYRLCFGKTKSDIVSKTIPTCIHSFINQNDKFGDVYQSVDDVKLYPNVNENNIDKLEINDEIKKYMDDFNTYFIKEALKINYTLGLIYKKLTGIFIGTKSNDNITVFNLQPLPTRSINETLKNVIKQENINKIYKIKLLCNWTNNLYNDWKKMHSNKIKELEIVEKDPDYWIIINKPPPNEFFNPSRTIVFRMEPFIDSLPQYNDWLTETLTKDKFLYFLEHKDYRNNSEWWLSKNVDELNSNIIDKDLDLIDNSPISAIVSSQYEMEGHKLRIDFIKYFQENSKYAIDIFGYNNLHQLKNYKGSLPTKKKDKGLFPYKYTLVVENSNIDNYFTEKFIDGVLSECLCFYWGSNNLGEFINDKAFIRLDLNNKENSVKIIEEAINNNEWEKRIKIIRKEKYKIVNYYNFFPRVNSLLDIVNNIEFHSIVFSENSIKIPGINITNNVLTRYIDLQQIKSKMKSFVHNNITLFNLTRTNDHINLWEKCFLSNKIFCILENQAKNNFLDHFTTILSKSKDYPEWDIIFLGINRLTSNTDILEPYIPYINNFAETKQLDNGELVKVLQPTIESYGYIISPRGAKKFMDIINKTGIILSMNELLLIFHNMIEIKSFLTWKNLIEDKIITPPETELLHIFRRSLLDMNENKNSFSNAPVELKIPPTEFDVILMTNNDMKKVVEQQNNNNVERLF
jgi:hypothetical protein